MNRWRWLMGKKDGNGRDDRINSLIGPGATFAGDCTVEGNIRVDGHFEGSLKVAHVAVVGKTGIVRGEIVAEEAVIGGRVLGNVLAANRVELQVGAHVEGDIVAQTLVVDEGVFFQGNCRMREEGAEGATLGARSQIDSR